MKIISLLEENCLTVEQSDQLAGKFLDRDAYTQLFEGEDTTVYKPSGDLLLKLRVGRLSKEAREAAYPALLPAARATNNRGIAAGSERFRGIKQDGSVSKTLGSFQVSSGIAGYYDRYARIPYCRTTAYTAENIQRFSGCYPLVKEVSELFKHYVPSRYKAQEAKILATNPDFRLPQSVFTTITVNKNWQTAVHKDAGDLAAGFGVLSVLERGVFDGGYLVLPRYKCAVRLREGDILFYDVHEWHGNTPFITSDFNFVRLGLVFYYRAKMDQCGSAEEELERAKRLGTGPIPLPEAP